jgi:hypothetical protein
MTAKEFKGTRNSMELQGTLQNSREFEDFYGNLRDSMGLNETPRNFKNSKGF